MEESSADNILVLSLVAEGFFFWLTTQTLKKRHLPQIIGVLGSLHSEVLQSIAAPRKGDGIVSEILTIQSIRIIIDSFRQITPLLQRVNGRSPSGFAVHGYCDYVDLVYYLNNLQKVSKSLNLPSQQYLDPSNIPSLSTMVIIKKIIATLLSDETVQSALTEAADLRDRLSTEDYQGFVQTILDFQKFKPFFLANYSYLNKRINEEQVMQETPQAFDLADILRRLDKTQFLNILQNSNIEKEVKKVVQKSLLPTLDGGLWDPLVSKTCIDDLLDRFIEVKAALDSQLQDYLKQHIISTLRRGKGGPQANIKQLHLQLIKPDNDSKVFKIDRTRKEIVITKDCGLSDIAVRQESKCPKQVTINLDPYFPALSFSRETIDQFVSLKLPPQRLVMLSKGDIFYLATEQDYFAVLNVNKSIQACTQKHDEDKAIDLRNIPNKGDYESIQGFVNELLKARNTKSPEEGEPSIELQYCGNQEGQKRLLHECPMSIKITQREIKIGRGQTEGPSKNDLIFSPTTNKISSSHCSILYHPTSGWCLKDNTSSHGSYMMVSKASECMELYKQSSPLALVDKAEIKANDVHFKINFLY